MGEQGRAIAPLHAGTYVGVAIKDSCTAVRAPCQHTTGHQPRRNTTTPNSQGTSKPRGATHMLPSLHKLQGGE